MQENNLPLFLALISAFSAALSPVIVSFVNARKDFKLKQYQSLFTSKLEAYNSFVEATSEAMYSRTDEALIKLHKTSSRAFLLSSEYTQDKLSAFAFTITLASDLNPELYKEAILAMKEEINILNKSTLRLRDLNSIDIQHKT